MTAATIAELNAAHLVVVDPSVEDWRTLVADLAFDAGLLVLDPARDGMQAIVEAVAGRRDLSAIHIVAHGRAGEIRLGSAILSSASLDSHAGALARIGRALQAGGNILLYGCDVARGEAGHSFVERFAQIAGADVAAAAHPVGACARGGSFELDVRIGAIAAATPFAARSLVAFDGLLDGGAGGSSQVVSGGAGGTGNTGQPGTDGDGAGVGGGGGGGASGTTTGGAGGTGGGDGTGLSGGAGGSGGDGPGGAGQDGTDGATSSGTRDGMGGGGGGGGVAGNGTTGTLTGNSTGGAGGSGGAGGDGGSAAVETFGGGGGGGGAGGYGAIVTGSVDNTFTVLGGAGGGGGGAGVSNGIDVEGASGNGSPGNDGDGGVGLQVVGSGFTVTNSGSITGGAGGGGALAGSGGVGLLGAGLTVVNSGTIAGGNGLTQANAIEFTGGANTLTLSGAWSMTGGIALDTSSTSVTFDQSTAQTVGNAISGSGSVIQDGNGTLTLSGGSTYLGGTDLEFGTLAVSGSFALGTGTLTMADGTVLQAAATASLGNAIALTGTDTLDTDGHAIALGGSISGTGKFVQVGGGGTLTLTATSNYSGAILIKAGTLVDDGSIADAPVEIQNGATFGGDGSAGAVTVDAGGSFAPDTDSPTPTTVTVAGLTLNSGSKFDEEFTQFSGDDQTVVQSGGTISLGGATLDLSLFNGFTPSVGQSFTIIKNDTGSAVSGTFAGLAQGAAFTQGGVSYSISYTGGSGNDVVLTVVSQAPLIGGTGNAVTFNQGQASPTNIDSAITLTDPTSADIASATVTISSGYQSGDTLAFDNGKTSESFGDGAVIGASQSGDTLTLTTLSGSATAADYQDALASVTYSFAGDPTDGGTDKSRTVTWSVTDTDNLTSAAGSTTTLNVYMSPALGGSPATTPTVTSIGGAVTADSNLTITDDNTIGDTASATVTISGGGQSGDALSIPAAHLSNFIGTGGKTFTAIDGTDLVLFGNDSTTLTLDGILAAPTVADLLTAFHEVQFDTTSADNGTRTLTWSFDDEAGGNANDSNAFSTSVGVEFGPQIGGTGNTVAFYQGQASPTTIDGAITLTDPTGPDIASATVAISSGFQSGDTLAFDNGGSSESFGDSAVIGASQSGDVLTLTTLSGNATATDYQDALASVTYSFAGDPTVGGTDKSRTITWSVTDADSLTGAAGSTTTLNVFAQPIVTVGSAGTPTVTSTSGPVTADPTLSVTDYNGQFLTTATVTISSGYQTGDLLTVDGIAGITSGAPASSSDYEQVPGKNLYVNFDTGNGTLSVVTILAAPVTDVVTALDEVQFSAVSPDNGTRTLTWQVSDQSSNGVNNFSSPVTTTVSPATPLVTASASNINASASETFAPAQLFSASDAGLPILDYEVEDESSGANNGFWVLNGAVLTSGQLTTLTAAQLSELSFVAGSASTPVTDTLEVAASDAAALGAFTSFTVTAAAHVSSAAPTVTAANVQDAPGLTLGGSSLFAATASGGSSVVSYEVEDITSDSGHWVFDGTAEPTNQLIDVTAAQLSELSFATGYGSDTLMVRANDGSQWSNFESFTVTPPPNAAPPAGTGSILLMERGSDGAYEFYNIGHNTILLAGAAAQIDPTLQVAGLGGFDGSDTADLLMRDPTTGAFTLYDVSNNNVTGHVAVGQVGLEWTVSGFGDFSGHAGETDMLMRNSNTGQFEVFDIANNAITFSAPMGQVGLEWSIAGFGDFSTRANETDMLMRNSNTGQFEVYDIVNNTITSSASMGQVGLEWTIAGFGDFSTRANETDMLMRNSNTGAFEVYDIANNTITSFAPMGQVGLEWTIAGFGDFSGNANETDMLMRNSNTGAFELYDISNNAITSAAPMGQVGLEWSIGGVSASPTSAPPATQLSGVAADPAGAAPSSATSQLTQTMASFAPASMATAASSPLEQATLAPSIAGNLLTTPQRA